MITIRKAVAADMPAVWKLIYELAEYENAPEQVTTSPAQMERDGFGENPLFQCLVAENVEKEIVAIALYYFAYSTWKGKMLYLDDLVVTEKSRRHKLGWQLIHELMEIGKAENAKLIRWQVLEWNIPAIRFYEKLGAELDGEWINCKIML